jgi:hypothetical protein
MPLDWKAAALAHHCSQSIQLIWDATPSHHCHLCGQADSLWEE